MLDTRSGRLLASKSFNHTFSQLQFAQQGLSYLLHKSHDAVKELIELHHLDLASNTTTLITSFIHQPQLKTRPSQWRGSLSPDGSLFFYQNDVLQPEITVVDAVTGKAMSRIHWEGDLSPLPGFVDPQNERIVVPLARWDERYSYANERKLLVASLKTGEVQGLFDVPQHIRHVQFHDDHIVLIDNENQFGHLESGATAINWKPVDAAKDKSRNHYLYTNRNQTGLLSKANNEQEGTFRLISSAGLATSHFNMETGFLPVGLRDGMLVSEKYATNEMPAWLQKINHQCCSIFGRYLISPTIYTVRYQDAVTGQLLSVQHLLQRNGESWQTHRVAGKSRLASVHIAQDHLNIEISEVFPFWSAATIALLAGGLLMVMKLIQSTIRKSEKIKAAVY